MTEHIQLTMMINEKRVKNNEYSKSTNFEEVNFENDLSSFHFLFTTIKNIIGCALFMVDEKINALSFNHSLHPWFAFVNE